MFVSPAEIRARISRSRGERLANAAAVLALSSAGWPVNASTSSLNRADVAEFVLGKSTWAVLALTCHIEIFTLVHYKKSVEPDANLSELWKDVFLHHWREEPQHAIFDELEWHRVDAKLTATRASLGLAVAECSVVRSAVRAPGSRARSQCRSESK